MNDDPTQIEPSFTLVGQNEEFAGQSFSARGELTIIGREPGCDIRLDEDKISRQHCRISCIDGDWTIEDLDSSNGTSVNGQRVAGLRRLNHNDTVGLGVVKFTFQLPGVSESPDNAKTVVDHAPGRQQVDPSPVQAPQMQPERPVLIPCFILAAIALIVVCVGGVLGAVLFGPGLLGLTALP